MSIVYNEFVTNSNTTKPDWFLSDGLNVVFLKPEYVPKKEHSFNDVKQYIYPYGSIKITSARTEVTEDQTLYCIKDLKSIKTQGGKYMLFFDNITNGLIFVKDIPIQEGFITLTFKGPLFILDRSGNVNFYMPSMGFNFKPGKHKLVIK
jgi:hypothetical protein